MTQRPRDIARSILELLAVAIAVLLIYGHLHPAHAGVDPVPIFIAAGTSGWDDFAANGPLWGTLLIAYAGLQTFLSRQHWLAQGRLLAVLTGVSLIGAAVINWHWMGAPSSGIMTAALAAIALVWHPTISGTPARPAALTAIGRVAMLAIVMLGIGCSIQLACSSPAVKTAGRIAWDCTSSERKQAVYVLTPLATNAILNGVSPDGKHIDLTGLKAAASKASILSDLGITLWCAASEAIAAIANPPAAAPGDPQTAPLEVDPAALRSAWQAIKPDAAFVTGVRDATGNQVVM